MIEKEGLAPGTPVGLGVVYVSFKKNRVGANEHTVKFDNGETETFKGWAPATDEGTKGKTPRTSASQLFGPDDLRKFRTEVWWILVSR